MQKKKGFTLIELLVVIAIIAILAAILFPVFARARENARRASCQSNLKQVGLGVFQYTQDYDEKYPPAVIAAAGTATPNHPRGWADALQPYLKSTQLFQCPSETGAPVAGTAAPWTGLTNPEAVQYTDYWYNRQLGGQSQASVEATALTVMNGDGNGAEGYSYYYYDGCNANPAAATVCPDYVNATTQAYITGLGTAHGRHLDGANFAYADGHVKWLKGNNVVTATGNPINGSTAVRNAKWSNTQAGNISTFGIN